jgi:hypothetical protein
MTVSAINFRHHQPSPFARLDVCRQAGLGLPDGVYRPVFEDDRWDFTDVVGLPVEMSLANRRFDFAAITDPRWRLVAKELVLAMLAPQHRAVAPLPRAYRTALHLRSCAARLEEAVRFFDWLHRRGINSLTQIDTQVCEAYLAFRRYVLDEDGVVVGEQSPGSDAQPRRSSSTWSTTGTCSPPIAFEPICGPGAGRPPRPSPRCRQAGPKTRPSRSPRRSCNRCSPRHCT